MGKQQILVEAHALLFAAGADFHGQGQTGQARVGLPAFAVEGHGHQAGRALDQRQIELLGQPVAEVGGANLGNAQTAGGNDQIGGLHQAAIGFNLIAAIAFCV